MQFWEKVFWSDETKVELFGRNIATNAWRKNGTAFKKHNTIPTVVGGCHLLYGDAFHLRVLENFKLSMVE